MDQNNIEDVTDSECGGDEELYEYEVAEIESEEEDSYESIEDSSDEEWSDDLHHVLKLDDKDKRKVATIFSFLESRFGSLFEQCHQEDRVMRNRIDDMYTKLLNLKELLSKTGMIDY